MGAFEEKYATVGEKIYIKREDLKVLEEYAQEVTERIGEHASVETVLRACLRIGIQQVLNEQSKKAKNPSNTE